MFNIFLTNCFPLSFCEFHEKRKRGKKKEIKEESWHKYLSINWGVRGEKLWNLKGSNFWFRAYILTFWIRYYRYIITVCCLCSIVGTWNYRSPNFPFFFFPDYSKKCLRHLLFSFSFFGLIFNCSCVFAAIPMGSCLRYLCKGSISPGQDVIMG